MTDERRSGPRPLLRDQEPSRLPIAGSRDGGDLPRGARRSGGKSTGSDGPSSPPTAVRLAPVAPPWASRGTTRRRRRR